MMATLPIEVLAEAPDPPLRLACPSCAVKGLGLEAMAGHLVGDHRYELAAAIQRTEEIAADPMLGGRRGRRAPRCGSCGRMDGDHSAQCHRKAGANGAAAAGAAGRSDKVSPTVAEPDPDPGEQPAPPPDGPAPPARRCSHCKRPHGTHTPGCKTRRGCRNCQQTAPEKCARHGGRTSDERSKEHGKLVRRSDRVSVARAALEAEMTALRARLGALEKAHAALADLA